MDDVRVLLGHADPDWDRELAIAFGVHLRRCRRLAGMSQEMLERLSRVDQAAISRVERGLVPRMPFAKVLRLGHGLGRSLPLGTCPHDHECAWQPFGSDEADPGAPP
jgi:transcriptional regulator with XRE-family HTH domain